MPSISARLPSMRTAARASAAKSSVVASATLPEDPPTQRQFDLADTISQKPVVSDALETPGEHVEEKAPEKFDRVQCECALPVPPLVILPAKGHCGILTGEQPAMRDRHAMGVAGEVVENMLRACERPFGVDDPLGVP